MATIQAGRLGVEVDRLSRACAARQQTPQRSYALAIAFSDLGRQFTRRARAAQPTLRKLVACDQYCARGVRQQLLSKGQPLLLSVRQRTRRCHRLALSRVEQLDMGH